MAKNFERELNGMAAEREHNLEEYYAYMAVRVLDGYGAGAFQNGTNLFTAAAQQ